MTRIIQISPSLLFGDAVGNLMCAIDSMVKEEGFDASICADLVHPRIDREKHNVVNTFAEATEKDILILHMASAYDRLDEFVKSPAKKIMVYHNVTPPHFFNKYNLMGARACREGLQQTRSLAGEVDFCIADSAWNKQDLIDMGYTCPIEVCPVYIPWEDYKTPPNASVLERYRGVAGTNVMFCGRVVPNKCHQDIVKAFWAYKNHYDPDARLFLVGAMSEVDPFCVKLNAYIHDLGLDDSVIFPGHIGFDEILAYYTLADVFLCQSEHEGFCVPLLEAAVFDTPVVAYDAAAISWTLGGSGILLDEKDPFVTAGVMDRVVRDEKLRAEVIAGQRQRLEYFSAENVRRMFLDQLYGFLKGQQ